MDLKGSKTEANLMAAFEGESQARTKYIFYAEKAKRDGYQQIGEIFEETAKQETAHARLWLELLRSGLPDTKGALEDAAGGEHFEWTEMYKEFAEKAREEGFERIAWLFEAVGKIEKMHEERFRKLIGNMQNNMVFSRDGDAIWICSNCGHVYIGKEAPQQCPVCSYPKAYFKLKAENY